MPANPDELAKFAAMAQDWWNPSGPMKPLHQLNPLRLQAIQKIVSLDHKRVLDVGCGGGLLSEAMAEVHAEVLGIDLNEPLLQVARQHAQAKKLKLEYRLVDSAQLAKDAPENFEVVTCMELLEHVPDPEQIIQDCAKLVKPGGTVFVATINRNWQSFLKAIVGAEFILNLLPKGTHEYGQFIRPSELAVWASRSGLRFKGLQGFGYNPLTGQFSLNTDVSVNYMASFER
jgi:2-polyprenyl-6-hydroxyphenyl methylase/3-demethylubiquinone-9 3-methyltransferase